MESTAQRLRYTDLAPAGIAAMRSVEHYLNTASNLDPILLGLIRLRASLLNGCEYCIGLHTHELQKHHEPETRITQLTDWRTSDAYTQRERAAFAWTETITNIQQDHAPQSAFEAAREHFTDIELTNLTLAIASINAFNRMAIAFRAQHTAKPQPPAAEATEGDGGKVAED
jgi:AhpD family alkylhydroperoxidase